MGFFVGLAVGGLGGYLIGSGGVEIKRKRNPAQLTEAQVKRLPPRQQNMGQTWARFGATK